MTRAVVLAFLSLISNPTMLKCCSIYLIVAFGLVCVPGGARSQSFSLCGELATHYGPYDYWTDRDKLPIVEKHHFTLKVETLRAGQEGYIGGDLDYVLHAFPNHSRALAAMVRLAEKEKKKIPQGAKYPVECYFDRAIRFRPKDGVVRMLYGAFLVKANKKAEAVQQLDLAAESGVDTPNFNYNMGLAYFEVERYDDSLKYAHRAYAGGYSLPGLKSKLAGKGKWREPPPEAAPTPSATAGTEPGKPSADKP